MRIGLAIMSLQLAGGTEHDIVHLSAGLKKAGHEPVVITSGGRLCKDVEANGVEIVLCPMNARSLGELRRNGRRLAEIVESHGIEVLNPQGVYPGISGRLASRRLLKKGMAVPNVITIHMLNKPKWWYYKLGAFVLNRVADHIIVESDCERLRLQRRGMNRPLTVLYNCFPPDKYAGVGLTRQEVRRQMGWGDDKIVFIMPARMSQEKNHRLLFEALADEKLKAFDGRILHYLAGDGPLLETNQAMVVEAGLSDRVVFGGFRRDIPTLLRGADVYLLCSKYESLPLSIREAMGASLPVVSTDVGGICEAVEDGKSGLLVPPDDPPALARAMGRLADDAKLRRNMGRRGYELFRQKFDYDNWIRRTAEVFEEARRKFIEKRG